MEDVVEIPREETWWRRGEQVLEFLCMSDDDSLRGVDGDSMRNHEVMSSNSLLHLFLDINLFRFNSVMSQGCKHCLKWSTS